MKISPLIPSKKMTVLDLFSGAGGMSCGFARRHEFQMLAAVDLEIGKPGKGKLQSGPVKLFCNETYEAIARYAELWIGDRVPNQPIRMDGTTFACEVGYEHFSQALVAWEAII